MREAEDVSPYEAVVKELIHYLAKVQELEMRTIGMQSQISDLKAENERLLWIIDKYGRHFGECKIARSPFWSDDPRNGKCTCGFEAALNPTKGGEETKA